jgi:hypothetical protein
VPEYWALKGAFCSWAFLGSGSAGSSAGSTWCMRSRVDSLRCVACCMVRVRVAYAGRVDCLRCVELLPSQVGPLPWRTPAESGAATDVGADRSGLLTLTADWLTWRSPVESGAMSAASLLEVRIFIPLLLGCVRTSWRRSWSCGRWLASTCIGRPRAAVYKNCLRPLHGVCWLRSLLVCLTVIEGVWLSVWLWAVPTNRTFWTINPIPNLSLPPKWSEHTTFCTYVTLSLLYMAVGRDIQCLSVIHNCQLISDASRIPCWINLLLLEILQPTQNEYDKRTFDLNCFL